MTTSLQTSWALRLGLLLSLFCAKMAAAEVTLEVLNPRGEIVPEEVHGISPRLPEMAGKTIGLFDNGKRGVAEFMDVVEGLISQQYPTAAVKRYHGAFDIGDKLANQASAEVNAVIYGVGD